LIEKIVALVERPAPIALIGPGGIGKTSIALTVLHDDRIKQRFHCCFIHCDELRSSLTQFLRRLSEAIGANIENPEVLAPLRPFLSSREILIVLDNAEFILDPQGANAQGIYHVVEELSRFRNICLCITSRISTIPPNCETFDIPTLSMEAAHTTFYHIYKCSELSDQVKEILKQLDFHPLSITLLATVAHQNKWGTKQLIREWERQKTGMLQTEHSNSLAATIDLSLMSQMFQKLGPDARELLGIIAFFPQGVNENNLDWLFPTISNGNNILNKFCLLSLTYRRDEFVTMLAPLRDHLCPKDPMSSALLCMTRDCYFTQLSFGVDPNRPSSKQLQWITLEDVNIEHLLDVFTSTNVDLKDAWDACANFMYHLFWHKQQLIGLGKNIKGLPDDHPSKPHCLYHLSQLFGSGGNQVECKQLLTQP